MRVYLDTCTFNRPFDDHSNTKVFLEAQAKLLIQEKIKTGEYALVWSYILAFENEMNPFPEKRLQIQQWEKYAIETVEESKILLGLAEKYVQAGLKAKDGLHVASAIEGSAKFFISTDKLILSRAKVISGISIISPLRFIEQEVIL